MRIYRFDEYQLIVDRQLLLRNEHVIPLSAKLFGILHCLVRSGGRIVTKDELVSEVWQHSDVSDATVVQHVSMLRRAMNEEPKSHQTILTVPGRGYRFIPAVSADAGAESAAEIRSVEHALRGEPRVWREYFIGIRHMERRDRNSVRIALKHFNAALGDDQTFAPAWTGLAGAYSNMAFYAFTTWDRVLPQAIDAIDKALYFDSRSALAHCVKSQIQLAQWDIEGSERSLDHAGNVDAGAAAVYHLSAFINTYRGDFELAIANAKRTLRISPADVAAQGIFANALAAQGDCANAIASYTNILEVDPACRIARQGRCEAYVASGELGKAMQDLKALEPTPGNTSRLACVYAFLGDRLSAARLLNELKRRSYAEYVEPHALAQVYIALGNYDGALRLTEKAVASHDVAFPAMLSSPLLSRPLQDSRLRQMFGDVRNLLAAPRRKIG